MYTTYNMSDYVPNSKNGYVITPDGLIHQIHYKFIHNSVIVSLFKEEAIKSGINSIELDDSLSPELYEFVNKMPVVTISNHVVLSVYWNKGLTKIQINSVEHILKYVYGYDGDEKVEFSNLTKPKTVNELLGKMKNEDNLR